MIGMMNQAENALNTQDKNDGWAAGLWGGMKNILGDSKSRNKTQEAVNEFNGYIKQLQGCKTEAEFKTKFRQLFGVEYSPELIQANKAYQDRLVAVEATHALESSFANNCKLLLSNSKLLAEHGSSMDGYDASMYKTKEEVYNREFKKFAEFVGGGDAKKGTEILNND